MRWRSHVAVVALGIAIVLTSGCTKTMMFSTATKVGLDISQRADQVVDMTLGYDRVEVVSIPVKPDTDATGTDDTYSVLGIFDLRYGNPFAGQPLTLNQFFGTGAAARQMAQDPRFQRFFGRQAGELAPQPSKEPKP